MLKDLRFVMWKQGEDLFKRMTTQLFGFIIVLFHQIEFSHYLNIMQITQLIDKLKT